MITSLAAVLALKAAFMGPADPVVTQNIVYATVGGTELAMDVYTPPDAHGKLLPGVIVVHGGAWISGKREMMAQLCDQIARQGMVAATVSYRLAPKSKWPAMIDDVQTAVRFFRANAQKFSVDPNRIGAAGASAGAHLALLTGYTETRDPKPTINPEFSSRTKAVLDLFGPVDMNRDFPPSLDPVFFAVLGKARKDSVEVIKAASPATYISKTSSPTFIFHGKADPLVPFSQAELLESLLKAQSVPYETAFLDGIGHEVKLDDKACTEAIGRGIAFLKKHL